MTIEIQNQINQIIKSGKTEQIDNISIKSYAVKVGEGGKTSKIVVVRNKGQLLFAELGTGDTYITRDTKGKENYHKIASRIGGSKEIRDYICGNQLPLDAFDFTSITAVETVHRDFCEEFVENGVRKLNLFNKQQILDSIMKTPINIINKDYSLIEHYLKTMFKDSYPAICNFIQYRRKKILNLVKIGFVLTGTRQVGKSTFYEILLSDI